MLPAQVREDVLDRETSLKLSTGKKLSTTHKELYVKKDEKSTCLRHSLSTMRIGRYNGNQLFFQASEGLSESLVP